MKYRHAHLVKKTTRVFYQFYNIFMFLFTSSTEHKLFIKHKHIIYRMNSHARMPQILTIKRAIMINDIKNPPLYPNMFGFN